MLIMLKRRNIMVCLQNGGTGGHGSFDIGGGWGNFMKEQKLNHPSSKDEEL